MKIKELYEPPQTTVMELDYAEPVCQTTSGYIYDYDVIEEDDILWVWDD